MRFNVVLLTAGAALLPVVSAVPPHPGLLSPTDTPTLTTISSPSLIAYDFGDSGVFLDPHQDPTSVENDVPVPAANTGAEVEVKPIHQEVLNYFVQTSADYTQETDTSESIVTESIINLGIFPANNTNEDARLYKQIGYLYDLVRLLVMDADLSAQHPLKDLLTRREAVHLLNAINHVRQAHTWENLDRKERYWELAAVWSPHIQKADMIRSRPLPPLDKNDENLCAPITDMKSHDVASSPPQNGLCDGLEPELVGTRDTIHAIRIIEASWIKRVAELEKETQKNHVDTYKLRCEKDSLTQKLLKVDKAKNMWQQRLAKLEEAAGHQERKNNNVAQVDGGSPDQESMTDCRRLREKVDQLQSEVHELVDGKVTATVIVTDGPGYISTVTETAEAIEMERTTVTEAMFATTAAVTETTAAVTLTITETIIGTNEFSWSDPQSSGSLSSDEWPLPLTLATDWNRNTFSTPISDSTNTMTASSVTDSMWTFTSIETPKSTTLASWVIPQPNQEREPEKTEVPAPWEIAEAEAPYQLKTGAMTETVSITKSFSITKTIYAVFEATSVPEPIPELSLELSSSLTWTTTSTNNTRPTSAFAPTFIPFTLSTSQLSLSSPYTTFVPPLPPRPTPTYTLLSPELVAEATQHTEKELKVSHWVLKALRTFRRRWQARLNEVIESQKPGYRLGDGHTPQSLEREQKELEGKLEENKAATEKWTQRIEELTQLRMGNDMLVREGDGVRLTNGLPAYYDGFER